MTRNPSTDLYRNPELQFRGEIPSGRIGWRSPSNIALVKYWGKKPVQLPQNPSVSFTLKNSNTETVLEYMPADERGMDVVFYFDGERNEQFEKKTKNFFDSLKDTFPFIGRLKFVIHSKNNFPHSAGIASSASGMSALALILCDLERNYFNTLTDDDEFFRKASYIARLGSGSACRSVYGGISLWGDTEGLPGTSDLYAFPVQQDIHPDFLTYRDTILLIDAGQKKVSSRVGHSLMDKHPFAKQKYKLARKNLKVLLDAMSRGDFQTFIRITELEALSMHAMMMTSNPYYLLMKPNTLNIIERVFNFRQKQNTPVSFTLDAGPNVHLLYPAAYRNVVMNFIENELMPYLTAGGYIDDEVGNGPERIKDKNGEIKVGG
ncbi:MAG: diphosphomevalonate decarboxylase [Chlorobi bacterium]|nr:diphosphomevalonate decarboxylase [Chlorobiota bacterium]